MASDALHVTYGDALAHRASELGVAVDDWLVMREAFRDGPLTPGPATGLDAFVALRAQHLIRSHGADSAAVASELLQTWRRIGDAAGPIVLHVDVQPCIDCSTFVACVIEFLHAAGRGANGTDPGVAVAHGVDGEAVALTDADAATVAGLWELLEASDAASLTLAATDIEGAGAVHAIPELPAMLARRAAGDVALEHVHP